MAQKELLKMQHIDKQFPGVIALKDVHFSLRAGEIHALLGENGAGKSTLIKVLTGVERMDGGSVQIEDEQVAIRSPLDAQKHGISTVYQEVNLCPHLTVAENIYVGREPLRAGRIDWKEIHRRSRELLKRFDLGIDVTKQLDNYPVAVQQMIAIARAVDVQAKILILDEPTRNFSPLSNPVIRGLLKEFKGAVISVSHDRKYIAQVCDKAYKLTAQGLVWIGGDSGTGICV